MVKYLLGLVEVFYNDGRWIPVRPRKNEVLERLDAVLSEEVKVLSNKSGKSVSLRITIPARFARALRIEPGDKVKIVLDPERGVLIIKPAKDRDALLENHWY